MTLQNKSFFFKVATIVSKENVFWPLWNSLFNLERWKCYNCQQCNRNVYLLNITRFSFILMVELIYLVMLSEKLNVWIFTMLNMVWLFQELMAINIWLMILDDLQVFLESGPGTRMLPSIWTVLGLIPWCVFQVKYLRMELPIL